MKVEKFKVLLYLKKSSLDKSRKAPIMGRITVNQSMSQFSLRLSCTPVLWNPRESRLDGKSREAVEVNQKIEKVLLDVHSAFDSLVERRKPFDAEAVKNLYQGSMGAQMTLLALLYQHIEELRSRIGIDIAPTTLGGYVYTHRSLGKFIKKKFKTRDVAFGQLNEQFIREYQDFVLGDLGYSMDSVRHFLAILKKMCKITFKEGISEKFHFAHYKLPKQKETTPKALSRESFEKIRDLEIAPNRHSHLLTRDLFLFACFTGLAYVDIHRLYPHHIGKTAGGRLYIRKQRVKTNVEAFIPLHPIAEQILLLYNTSDESKPVFPLLARDRTWYEVNQIGSIVGLKENLSYHQSRHCFGTLLLSAGVSIESVAKMMGHANINTTQVYTQITEQKISEDMDKLMESRKTKQNNEIKTEKS